MVANDHLTLGCKTVAVRPTHRPRFWAAGALVVTVLMLLVSLAANANSAPTLPDGETNIPVVSRN